jgi:hypothetical protein
MRYSMRYTVCAVGEYGHEVYGVCGDMCGG